MTRAEPGQSYQSDGTFSRTYAGAAGAPGVAMGHIAVVDRLDLASVPDRVVENVAAEAVAVRRAVTRARAELEHFQGASQAAILGAEARAIFDVYRHLLSEKGLVDEILMRVRSGNWARGALRAVIDEKAAVFEQLEDTYLRARAEDFREIGRRILHYLDASEGQQRHYPEDCVLAADEVGIVEIARVPRERLVGLVSKRGSVLSHAAVLARALNIPAVMGLADLSMADLDTREVVVDGHYGKLIVDPTVDTTAAYRAMQYEEARIVERLASLRHKPALTPDGARVVMFAKAGLTVDLGPIQAPEVEGIGLYRTEFAFMTCSSFPSENEQARTYRQVLEAMAPRPVVMRTLDAGGDKALPYFPVEERNPFLGWRGIRMSLDQPELLLTQLRAMLKSNHGLGNLGIMFPMIASVVEVDQALELLRQADRELAPEDGRLDGLRLGAMIEVPAAVYQIEALARRVDFVSIGTNDLVQYLLAVDRDNAHVANRYDTLHPAVIRALQEVCSQARRVGIPVGVCGEMAGEPEAVVLFIAMGVHDLSASPARLPFVKAVVRAITRRRAREVLREVLNLETGREVRTLLRKELVRSGLGDLIHGDSGQAESGARVR